MQQIRPGGSAILDEILIGCAVKGWKLSIKNSPGRAGAMCSGRVRGDGQVHDAQHHHAARRHRAARVQRRHDYGVDDQRRGLPDRRLRKAVRLHGRILGDNNFRPGFFPGSGTQDGYQVQGRFEWGDRSFGIQFVVRVQAGSTEVHEAHQPDHRIRNHHAHQRREQLVLDGDPEDGFFSVVELGNTDGIVTLQITGVQLYDAINGLLTVTVITPQNNIAQ